MIKIIKDEDIFNTNCEAIVNPVNTVGVMGAGFALKFKQKYPSNFQEYTKVASANRINIGEIFVYKLDTKDNPQYIFNFPTKKQWTFNSEYRYDDGKRWSLLIMSKYGETLDITFNNRTSRN